MGLFSKLKEGLTKTRNNIVSGIDSVFSGFSKIDDDFYDELEETLIMGDIGVHATEEIIEDLKEKVKENKIKQPEECKHLLIETIKEKMNLGENAYDFENKQSIVMLIGVNGVGKTTSVGKLAGLLKAQNKKVIMAAADTFRAAAIEQLTEQTWFCAVCGGAGRDEPVEGACPRLRCGDGCRRHGAPLGGKGAAGRSGSCTASGRCIALHRKQQGGCPWQNRN